MKGSKPAFSNCFVTDHGDARQTARAKPARRTHVLTCARPDKVEPDRPTCSVLSGKRTFAADTKGDGNAQRPGGVGPSEDPRRNETVGSNTYCHLGLVAYAAIVPIV